MDRNSMSRYQGQVEEAIFLPLLFNTSLPFFIVIIIIFWKRDETRVLFLSQLQQSW